MTLELRLKEPHAPQASRAYGRFSFISLSKNLYLCNVAAKEPADQKACLLNRCPAFSNRKTKICPLGNGNRNRNASFAEDYGHNLCRLEHIGNKRLAGLCILDHLDTFSERANFGLAIGKGGATIEKARLLVRRFFGRDIAEIEILGERK